MSDGSIITTAEELNYRDEANAAVTDADDVSAAGAVMISTAETTGAKTFSAATILNSTQSVGGNSVITGNVGIGINNPSSHLKQTDTDGHCCKN